MLISDHPLFREGLARVLNGSDGYRVVGQASSVEQALEVAGESPADVIIYDQTNDQTDDSSLVALLRLSASELVALSIADANVTVYHRRELGQVSPEDLLVAIQEARP